MEYDKHFIHNKQARKFKPTCSVKYIPLEARIDKVSFELFLDNTKPKQLVVINTT